MAEVQPLLSSRKYEASEKGKAKRHEQTQTSRYKALKKLSRQRCADTIGNRQREYQHENYVEQRGESAREYQKQYRKSEAGKAVIAERKKRKVRGHLEVTSGALQRGYKCTLHPDEIAALNKMPCIYCGTPECGGIDRLDNKGDYT